MSMVLTVVLILVVLAVLVGIYNSLIGKRNQVDQAFASVDVMLKKRYDLIPNLIATVEQYMRHERELLTELTELRTRAMSGDATPAQQIATEQQLSGALGRVMVAVENYPDLKASANFVQLQASLNETEEQISAARRTYNAAVTDLNDAIQMFPGSLFAGPMGITRRELFAASEAERQNVNVRELFQK